MATKVFGKKLPLSPARKLVTEMLHHASLVPSIPVSRHMNLARLAAARSATTNAPAWTSLFIRAYGIVAQQIPELRRAYIPWPWPHLYEHPFSVAALAIEREVAAEAVVLAAKITDPSQMKAAEIQQRISYLKNTPVQQIGDFRQLLLIGALPGFLRRFIFWQSLYLSGAKRAKRFGTCMVSTYGSLGAEQVHPITPLTTLLTFGPIQANGDVVVKIIYDHRVMDGRTVAKALAELQTTLDTTLVSELKAEQPAAKLAA